MKTNFYDIEAKGIYQLKYCEEALQTTNVILLEKISIVFIQEYQCPKNPALKAYREYFVCYQDSTEWKKCYLVV